MSAFAVSTDIAAIHKADGVAVTLTPSEGDPVETYGLVNRRDARLDETTGEHVNAPALFVEIAYTSEVANVDETWTVSTTDLTGESVSGKVLSAPRDRTRGVLLIKAQDF
jgi:hypothetical protein